MRALLFCADRDRVVRRGLALIIESDFVRSRPPRIHSRHAHHEARLTLAPLARAQYATDAGRQHFADQLTSIRYCVQETCSARRASNPRPSARLLTPAPARD